jgi:ABC-type bacteriocin/lantibiotic exporter with double-glycine peptidase domain
MSSEAAYFPDALASTVEVTGAASCASEIPPILLDTAQSQSETSANRTEFAFQTSEGSDELLLAQVSVDYHERTPTGEKLICLEHDVDEIANLGADTANQSVRAILFFVLNLAMMAKLSLPMTLTVLPLMPLFAVIRRRFSGLLRLRANETRHEMGSATSLLNEHLGAVPQIQFLGAEASSARRAVSVWDGMLRAQWVQRRTQVGFSLSIGATMFGAIVAVLGFGSAKVLSGALTIGGLVAFYTYGTRAFEPISSAMDLYARLQSVGASIRRVRELLALEPSVRDAGARRLESSGLKTRFQNRECILFV